MVESTAVYPTKYYAGQLKDAKNARFYVERKMVMKIPQKNPNIDFPLEAIVLSGYFKVERLSKPRVEEEQIWPQMIEVPFQPPISKPVLEITSEELQHALQIDIIEELGAEHLTKEEMLGIKQTLLSWIDEIAQDRALQLSEEAKTLLINIIALIMKKTNKTVKQSEG